MDPMGYYDPPPSLTNLLHFKNSTVQKDDIPSGWDLIFSGAMFLKVDAFCWPNLDGPGS